MAKPSYTFSSLPNRSAFRFLAECSRADYKLTSAEPILPIPDTIRQALKDSEMDNRRFDGTSCGHDSTLEQCVNFFRRHKINCDIKNVSLNEGILSAIAETYEILEIGKRRPVLVPTPTFGYYFQQLYDKGIHFDAISTRKEDNFLLDPAVLESAIKETGARILLLCYPNNPTGAVMTESNARAIAEVVKKHDVFVIQDAIFLENNLSSDKSQNFPIAAVEGMLERSFTLYGISKSMGAPGGTRTAIGVGRENFVKKFAKFGGYSDLDQKILTAALKDTPENLEYLEESRQKYLFNIMLVNEKIAKLDAKFSEIFGEKKPDEEPYVKPYIKMPAAGSVYLLDFLGLKGKMRKDEEISSGLNVAEWLLEDASVATVPGECSMFSPESMLVRITLGHSPEYLDKAFENIINATEKIQSPPRSSPSAAEASRIPEVEKEAAIRAQKAMRSKL